MISRGAGGLGVADFRRVHSTLHGFWKGHPSFLNPGSHPAHCSVANNGDNELFSSPILRDTVQSASDLLYVPRHQYLSLNQEGGIRVWRTSDFSVSRGVSFSIRRPINDIAEASGASEEPMRVEGEQLGISSSIATNGTVDNRFFPEVGGSKAKSKLDLTQELKDFDLVQELKDFDLVQKLKDFDPVQELKDFARQAEILKEEVTSLDYTVSPTPFTPVEGAEAIEFAAICVGLVFAFWLGNYYVPDLIFKNTVFKKEAKDPLDSTDSTSGDDYLAMSNQDSSEGSGEASTIAKGDAGSSAVKSGTGFSGSKKHNRPKSGRK